MSGSFESRNLRHFILHYILFHDTVSELQIRVVRELISLESFETTLSEEIEKKYLNESRLAVVLILQK